MKRFLLSVSVLALAIISTVGCSQQAKWNRAQRQQMREALREYRQMVYLDDLTDAEFMLFADDVALALEEDYPVYTTFVQMPGVNDTVQVYVVTTIVEELNADARNMRHIFPYRYLVEQNILPAGLDRAQQHAFYNCLAGKINNRYATMDQFVDAVLADTTGMSQISVMQQQCASDLFDWTVVIEEFD
ncbi:MAG TPA: hypothetical protein H9919_06345 [Candidatus Alistipes excrementipullorum]|nr:hypothetical protein [Candidatus Alistipes excrementipullorum]